MTLRLHLFLLLSLSWLVIPAAKAQTAEDFFHGGAMLYLSNNIPKAKEEVASGLKLFPDDVKLKKLEELLNQQQQQKQQQQQQKQDEQKQDEKKPDEKKSEQQQQQQNQEQKESKGDDKKQQQDPQDMKAHAMTPQEAKQLLDAQKGDEQVLQFRQQEPKNRGKSLKDW